MIAIPSVRGTGPTGWSCSFKDRDVAIIALPKAGRPLGGVPLRGFVCGRLLPPLGTRPVTMIWTRTTREPGSHVGGLPYQRENTGPNHVAQ